MADFFRTLGWGEAPSSEPVHRVFQLANGVVLALYGAEHYEREYGPLVEGFRGLTLGINLASRDEVLAAHEALKGVDGVRDLDEPVDSPMASAASASATQRGASGTLPGRWAHASTNTAP